MVSVHAVHAPVPPPSEDSSAPHAMQVPAVSSYPAALPPAVHAVWTAALSQAVAPPVHVVQVPVPAALYSLVPAVVAPC